MAGVVLWLVLAWWLINLLDRWLSEEAGAITPRSESLHDATSYRDGELQ